MNRIEWICLKGKIYFGLETDLFPKKLAFFARSTCIRPYDASFVNGSIIFVILGYVYGQYCIVFVKVCIQHVVKRLISFLICSPTPKALVNDDELQA